MEKPNLKESQTEPDINNLPQRELIEKMNTIDWGRANKGLARMVGYLLLSFKMLTVPGEAKAAIEADFNKAVWDKFLDQATKIVRVLDQQGDEAMLHSKDDLGDGDPQKEINEKDAKKMLEKYKEGLQKNKGELGSSKEAKNYEGLSKKFQDAYCHFPIEQKTEAIKLLFSHGDKLPSGVLEKIASQLSTHDKNSLFFNLIENYPDTVWPDGNDKSETMYRIQTNIDNILEVISELDASGVAMIETLESLKMINLLVSPDSVQKWLPVINGVSNEAQSDFVQNILHSLSLDTHSITDDILIKITKIMPYIGWIESSEQLKAMFPVMDGKNLEYKLTLFKYLFECLGKESDKNIFTDLRKFLYEEAGEEQDVGKLFKKLFLHYQNVPGLDQDLPQKSAHLLENK